MLYKEKNTFFLIQKPRNHLCPFFSPSLLLRPICVHYRFNSRSNSTKPPTSEAGNFGEHRRMSQVWKVHEVVRA